MTGDNWNDCQEPTSMLAFLHAGGRDGHRKLCLFAAACCRRVWALLDDNTVRLHSAIGYVTPQDKLRGRDQEILAARDCKLEQAHERRRSKRQQPRQAALDGQPANATT